MCQGLPFQPARLQQAQRGFSLNTNCLRFEALNDKNRLARLPSGSFISLGICSEPHPSQNGGALQLYSITCFKILVVTYRTVKDGWCYLQGFLFPPEPVFEKALDGDELGFDKLKVCDVKWFVTQNVL